MMSVHCDNNTHFTVDCHSFAYSLSEYTGYYYLVHPGPKYAHKTYTHTAYCIQDICTYIVIHYISAYTMKIILFIIVVRYLVYFHYSFISNFHSLSPRLALCGFTFTQLPPILLSFFISFLFIHRNYLKVKGNQFGISKYSRWQKARNLFHFIKV